MKGEPIDYRRILITPTDVDGGKQFFVRCSQASAQAGDTIMYLGNEHLLKLDGETFLQVRYLPMSLLKQSKE
jgi:hypothetical protein